MNVFIILQLSRSVHLRRKLFSAENKESKTTNITRNAGRSDILTLLKLLNADAKSAVVLRVMSLIKLKYAISRC